eukprot:Skav211044  [mRNA]  locus=scaffold1434:306588:307109:- [translate_table: standard]
MGVLRQWHLRATCCLSQGQLEGCPDLPSKPEVMLGPRADLHWSETVMKGCSCCMCTFAQAILAQIAQTILRDRMPTSSPASLISRRGACLPRHVYLRRLHEGYWHWWCGLGDGFQTTARSSLRWSLRTAVLQLRARHHRHSSNRQRPCLSCGLLASDDRPRFGRASECHQNVC